jgi:hypothetical protein
MNDVNFDPETGEILEPPSAPVQPAHEKPKRARKPKPKRPAGNGRAPIPKDETKRQKFLRLVNQRFDKIVKAVHHMRGLGRNQASYEYGDADVDRVVDLLVAELQAMAAEMKRRGKPVQTKLDLQ